MTWWWLLVVDTLGSEGTARLDCHGTVISNCLTCTRRVPSSIIGSIVTASRSTVDAYTLSGRPRVVCRSLGRACQWMRRNWTSGMRTGVDKVANSITERANYRERRSTAISGLGGFCAISRIWRSHSRNWVSPRSSRWNGRYRGNFSRDTCRALRGVGHTCLSRSWW